MLSQHRSDLARVANVFDCTQQLAKELHKRTIRKFEKRQVYLSFKEKMFGAIDIYSKYVWVVPLKDKKCFTITNPFQKILDEPNCSVANSEERKPNKI